VVDGGLGNRRSGSLPAQRAELAAVSQQTPSASLARLLMQTRRWLVGDVLGGAAQDDGYAIQLGASAAGPSTP
jgi:hypothetical protein